MRACLAALVAVGVNRKRLRDGRKDLDLLVLRPTPNVALDGLRVLVHAHLGGQNLDRIFDEQGGELANYRLILRPTFGVAWHGSDGLVGGADFTVTAFAAIARVKEHRHLLVVVHLRRIHLRAMEDNFDQVALLLVLVGAPGVGTLPVLAQPCFEAWELLDGVPDDGRQREVAAKVEAAAVGQVDVSRGRWRNIRLDDERLGDPVVNRSKVLRAKLHLSFASRPRLGSLLQHLLPLVVEEQGLREVVQRCC